MDLWALWLDGIHNLLQLLSVNTGWGAGRGVIALTLMFRTLLLPISWPIAYSNCVRTKKMARLQPQLQSIKERWPDNPQKQMQATLELYRDNGLKFLDLRSIAGGLVQVPIFLGMFQTLRDGMANTRFLWISNLSRPDPWLALAAAFATVIMMSANPDLPEHVRWFMIAVPTLLTLVAAFKFSSAVALYWAVSNLFTTVQTATLHFVVARRLKAGTLKI